MKIIITGQTPAKKNARQPFIRNGRMMNFPNKNYMAWEHDAQKQLLGIPKATDKPVSINYVFFNKDNRARDLDNMVASVNDTLQSMQIIVNDSWQWLSIAGAVGYLDKQNPRVELEIFTDEI